MSFGIALGNVGRGMVEGQRSADQHQQSLTKLAYMKQLEQQNAAMAPLLQNRAQMQNRGMSNALGQQQGQGFFAQGGLAALAGSGQPQAPAPGAQSMPAPKPPMGAPPGGMQPMAPAPPPGGMDTRFNAAQGAPQPPPGAAPPASGMQSPMGGAPQPSQNPLVQQAKQIMISILRQHPHMTGSQAMGVMQAYNPQAAAAAKQEIAMLHLNVDQMAQALKQQAGLLHHQDYQARTKAMEHNHATARVDQQNKAQHAVALHKLSDQVAAYKNYLYQIRMKYGGQPPAVTDADYQNYVTSQNKLQNLLMLGAKYGAAQ